MPRSPRSAMWGAITSDTMLISLMRMFMLGPEVSLNGSPTVSPVTEALWASEPLYSILPFTITPFSNDFLALSQAPPALLWNMAMSTPLTVTPASRPPNTSADEAVENMPRQPKPIIMGVSSAMAPGIIISRIAAWVLMATHFSYSGRPVPSMMPGISRNWRRTSWTMDMAARPTAAMASEEKMKGIMAPMNTPASTGALLMSMDVILAVPMKAANSASEVRAAEAMAKPLPVAAVVLPTASRMSVRSRTSLGNSLISAMPPALSAMGPKASMASCMAVVAIIPAAAMATP